MDTKQFIEKARKIHGNKYDYSKVVYIGTKDKIIIICPKHGEFMQTPNAHLTGSSCKVCNKYNGKKQIGIDKFIERAKKIHGNKYDYSKAIYNGADTKLTIICSKHGEFVQTPSKHVSRKQGCKKCATEKCAEVLRMTREEFIKKAKSCHDDRYDYSKVEYKNSQTPVEIICKYHGSFFSRPLNFLSPKGCPKCAGNVPWTTEEAIKNAIKKHGDKYNYSKFEYINADTKSIVICPYHGEFLTSPRIHINMGSGCPSCNESHGEKEITEILTKKGLEFRKQKRWDKCRDKYTLPFDFYIPSLNLAIEYDGEQHFMEKSHWGGIEEFKKIRYRDKIKTQFCLDENIKLLRINYTENIEEKLKQFCNIIR